MSTFFKYIITVILILGLIENIHSQTTYWNDKNNFGHILISKNGLYGLLDSNNIPIVPIQYEEIENYQGSVAKIKLNDLYGFIDKNGKEIIPIKYQWVSDFYEGLAQVRLYGKYGFIDKKGKVVLPIKYEGIYNFLEGLLKVKKSNNKWGLIDITGKDFKTLWYHDTVSVLIKGIVELRLNNLVEYYHLSKDSAIRLPYQRIYGFKGGKSLVFSNNMFGFIDKNGQDLEGLKYNSVINLGGGYLSIQHEGKMAAVNRHNKIITEFKYNRIENFDDRDDYLSGNYDPIDNYDRFGMYGAIDGNRLKVSLDGKCGLIDTSGNEITEIKYDLIEPFAEDGYFKVRHNLKWGIIDMIGKEVIPCIYEDEAIEWHRAYGDNLLAQVKTKNGWFLFDNDGKKLKRVNRCKQECVGTGGCVFIPFGAW